MPVPRSDPAVRLPPGARRAALLELLREREGGATVPELAEAVGLHPNTVRAHLDVLVRTGRATRAPARGRTPGRPREVYAASGAPDDDRNYRVLAQVLAARLAELAPDPAAAAVEAGAAWAAPRAPAPGAAPTGGPEADLRPLLRVLTEVGFRPALAGDGRTVELHHCPFLELATERPDVVCGAHLGLIRGTLDRTAPGVTATRILPFVRPDLCVAELAPSGADPLHGGGQQEDGRQQEDDGAARPVDTARPVGTAR